MKNLLNRVLVVLAVSAVFAGNIDAARDTSVTRKTSAKSAGAAATKSEMTEAQMALESLRVKGATPDAGTYKLQNKLDDIAIVREALPKEGAAIGRVEAAVKIKDQKARRDAFKEGSAAVNALAELKLALANTKLADANKKFEANPNEANAEKVAQAKTQAVAQVNELDDTAASGWKGYVTKRNIIMGSIGIATIAVSGYVYMYGVPIALKPFVDPATTKLGEWYKAAADSRVGKALGSFGTGAADYARSAAAALTFGYLGGKVKDAVVDTVQQPTQTQTQPQPVQQ